MRNYRSYETLVNIFNDMDAETRMDFANVLATEDSDSLFEIHEMEDFDEFMCYLQYEDCQRVVANSIHFSFDDEIFWLDPILGSEGIRSGSVSDCEYITPEYLAKFCIVKKIDVARLIRENYGWEREVYA